MLKIQTTPFRLGWNVQNARLEKSAIPKDSLDMSITKPELEIKTTPPKLSIDQSECRAEEGLKNRERFMRDNVEFSKRMVSEAIDRIVSDGNSMLQIESGIDVIPEQAEQSFSKFEHEFGLGFIPQSKPIIDVQRGSVDIKLNRGDVEIHNAPKPLEQGQYTAGRVEFFVKQYNSINISFQPDNKFSMKI